MSGCAWRNVLASLLISSCLAGCGSKPTQQVEDNDTAPAPVQQAGMKSYSAAELPKLDDPLPPLDNGRVENLAPPQGWERLPRDGNYLARFIIKGHLANDLPRILVTVEDAGSDLPTNVTAENVDAFADQIQAELTKFQEPAKALQLGDNYYARFVTGAKKGARSVDRQVLVTVQNGRRYSFTLEVYSDQILEHRDAAYATSAGVKYQAAGSSPAPTEPPADPPAESTDPPSEPASE